MEFTKQLQNIENNPYVSELLQQAVEARSMEGKYLDKIVLDFPSYTTSELLRLVHYYRARNRQEDT